MLPIKHIREMTGLSQVDFAKKYHIPRRTIENWESENETSKRTCPDYVLELLEFKVRYDLGCLEEK